MDVDISSSDLVNEGRLSNVGVTTDEKSSGVGVDGRETGDMLSNFLEVREGILLPLHDRRHSDSATTTTKSHIRAHTEQEQNKQNRV